MNSILGICAYAPTNLRCICLFFIHESWLFCVCYITLDYPSFITYPCIISSLTLFHKVMVMELENIFTQPRHPLEKYK